jgi:3',5'-cyclic-AMP phosphodiesterase
MTTHLIIQISDVHLTLDGKMAHIENADAYAGPKVNLLTGLDLLETAGIRTDLFVLTGDLADEGDARCYEELSGVFEDFTARNGSDVVFLPGNHDHRATFRHHLLKKNEDDSGPINQIRWVGGVRILALDSSVPGKDHGYLDDETITFVEESLSSPAPAGTLIALHHPPMPSPIEEMTGCSLQRPDRLAEAISGSDVRLIMCGHNHHEAWGSLGSVPVWTSPSSAFRADMTNQTLFRGVPGSAFSRIDIDDREIRASVFPIPAFGDRPLANSDFGEMQ